MIDFRLLEALMATARSQHQGKPLDNVSHLHTRKPAYRVAGMRNCRLFKINDTNWRVKLHDNTIARIVRLDDGSAQITVYNADEYPTMTTAERLSSVLGFGVYKRNNRLWAAFTGASEHTPLRSGQQFIIGLQGAFCTNPEIVTEQRTRILKEPSKPVLAYLRSIRKLAVPLIRLTDDHKIASADPSLPPDLDTEVSTDLVMRVIRAGAVKEYGRWRVDLWVDRGPPLSQTIVLQLFERGLKVYKDELYSAHGVYEQYTHSFKDQFKEYNDGRNAPLALAA